MILIALLPSTLKIQHNGEAIPFYKSVGFAKAGRTEAMWIYSGTEH